MLKILNQKYEGFNDFEYIRPDLYDQSLPDLKSRWTNDSITLGDILEHFSGFVEKFFRNEVDKFLVGRSNIVPRSLDILRTSRIPKTFFALGLISSVGCWSKKYFSELKEFYISAELHYGYPIFGLFDSYTRIEATKPLLNYRMEEFNVRRNPVILPKETTMEEPKSCLKPIVFINIGKLTP
ncbi:uncharacterized protein EV154DRAFT_224681 [Mucor mucedo]|uniref:uncharacterized protein n=1 Tax=Mucor mucedo TaxID=29922 RepID=UPI00221F5010|nr:uncharacterized protein EV154DRAFT_224681 [Mucor mucedo]KAI7891448.1 hypothetical protein EV154DRAFT_224681 [Mucor mucedo]